MRSCVLPLKRPDVSEFVVLASWYVPTFPISVCTILPPPQRWSCHSEGKVLVLPCPSARLARTSYCTQTLPGRDRCGSELRSGAHSRDRAAFILGKPENIGIYSSVYVSSCHIVKSIAMPLQRRSIPVLFDIPEPDCFFIPTTGKET
jgi:hypothetical protein